jgi:uncharacterized protein YqjF (DUF2071 family)
MNKSFLTAEWRKLAIANYAVDENLLLPYLPYKTEIDKWNNQCYVSLVGFRFVNTRLRGLFIPFHKNFEEINLRFYVRYKEDDKWRRGVTFIKEIVPHAAITFVANAFYNEKYMTLPTRHRWDTAADVIKVTYEWKLNKKWNTFSVSAVNTSSEIAVGSEAEFITEHYWGYTPINKMCCSEYEVIHPRWLQYKVVESSIDVEFQKLYGDEFAFLKNEKPVSVMLAEGSEIAVCSKRSIM